MMLELARKLGENAALRHLIKFHAQRGASLHVWMDLQHQQRCSLRQIVR